MSVLRRSVVVVVLLGLSWLAYRHFFPSDDARIRQLLHGLAATVTVPAKPTPVGTLLALDKLKACFWPEARVLVDDPFQGRHTFNDRDELVQAAAAAWPNLQGMKVEFLDINVTLDPGRTNATAELTAKAQRPGDHSLYVQEFRVRLRKQEKDWRIAGVETIRPLR